MHPLSPPPLSAQELCGGGTLLDTLRIRAPLPEDHAAGIFRGVIKAVLHCHQARRTEGALAFGGGFEGEGGAACCALPNQPRGTWRVC